MRKRTITAGICAAILLLFGLNLMLWAQTRKARQEASELREISAIIPQQEATIMAQKEELAQLKAQPQRVRQPDLTALGNAALDAMEEAEQLARALEKAERRLLETNPNDRNVLLRQHMRELVASAKNNLSPPPVMTETDPGKGILGRQIVFPVLLGSDGQTLRENAEVTSMEKDIVSVKFPGGSATYRLSELHPGIAGYLPVDPLLVLPVPQWTAEALRVHQTQNARRDEDLSRLRDMIEGLLPANIP
ncbi:MAG: hypothetical protein LBN38_00070 [Verrucomicrobiota bacterium]|nr:hypothetical protein [Verrucomicrobiota bacterium]